jgi:Amt family ammonium transporter
MESSGNIFLDCTNLQQMQENDGGVNATINIMQCVSDTYQDAQESREASLRSFLLLICGGMIFFMQSGFAMMCAGSVRLKNVQNTMLKNLLDACGAALAFYLVGTSQHDIGNENCRIGLSRFASVLTFFRLFSLCFYRSYQSLGYAFAFGGDLANPNASSRKTFIGYEDFVSVGPNAAFWFFEYTFSATSVTIVAGTLAERCQMVAYLAYSVVLAGFIYPVVAHSVWSQSGFLSRTNDDRLLDMGALDFAGAGVVHLNGGLIALYATLVLGPRRGRFYDAQGEPLVTPRPFPGHSVALQLLGTMILWFGWFGFNPGSALLLEEDGEKFGLVAANAAVATALSGATGGICALFTQLWWEERMTGEPKFVIQMAMNGALSGLVAVTSGCAFMEPYAAIITGLVAGWLYMLSSALLVKLRIDDAVNAIPVHMVNGLWGLLATGLFASPRLLDLTYGESDHPGFFYSFRNGGADANLLACQICASLFIFGWTFITMFPFFIWLNYK